MTDALTSEYVSPGLVRVAVRARREPDAQFHSLAHLIDVAALERAYHRQRKDAAVGVDGVTKEEYGQGLDANLRDLHGRLKAMRYRHQPIRRVHIPKDKGRTRPIGISAFEDKTVCYEAGFQRAGLSGNSVRLLPAEAHRWSARS